MLDEPPGADPHAGWCGEGGLETRPYPISDELTKHFKFTLAIFLGKTLPAFSCIIKATIKIIY